MDATLSLDSTNGFFRLIAVADEYQPASTFSVVGAENDPFLIFVRLNIL